MNAKYDALNPAALKRLIAAGTQLKPFSTEVMNACHKAALELYAETSAENAVFKKLLEAQSAFRDEEYFWFQVAEYSFDNYQIRSRGKG